MEPDSPFLRTLNGQGFPRDVYVTSLVGLFPNTCLTGFLANQSDCVVSRTSQDIRNIDNPPYSDRSAAYGVPNQNHLTETSDLTSILAAIDLLPPPPTLSPGAPLNVSGTASGNTVTVAWQPPRTGGPVTNYVVRTGTAPGVYNLFNGPVATTSVSGTVPSGTYYVSVAAQNATGLGAAAPDIIVTVAGTGAVPGVPQNVRGTAAGSTVTVTWQAPLTGGPITNYIVKAGTSPGVYNLFNGPVATTSVSGTVPSGTYYVSVAAQSERGVGPSSADVVIAVPSGSTPIPVVTSVLLQNAPTGGIAFNPGTNRLYVSGANVGISSVAVIDAATNSLITTITTPGSPNPRDVAVNPSTNRVYVTDVFARAVTVINGATNTMEGSIALATSARGIAINTLTNRIYVSRGNPSSSSTLPDFISVFDGQNGVLLRDITVGRSLSTLGVNETTNRVYAWNAGDGTVSVIDGASSAVIATVGIGTPANFQPTNPIKVNPVTNRIYVPAQASGRITVIDGVTNSVIESIPVGSACALSIDSARNRLYVSRFANESGNVMVIESQASNLLTGDTNSVSDVFYRVAGATTNLIFLNGFE